MSYYNPQERLAQHARNQQRGSAASTVHIGNGVYQQSSAGPPGISSPAVNNQGSGNAAIFNYGAPTQGAPPPPTYTPTGTRTSTSMSTPVTIPMAQLYYGRPVITPTPMATVNPYGTIPNQPLRTDPFASSDSTRAARILNQNFGQNSAPMPNINGSFSGYPLNLGNQFATMSVLSPYQASLQAARASEAAAGSADGSLSTGAAQH